MGMGLCLMLTLGCVLMMHVYDAPIYVSKSPLPLFPSYSSIPVTLPPNPFLLRCHLCVHIRLCVFLCRLHVRHPI
jgi:hypothetical protein